MSSANRLRLAHLLALAAVACWMGGAHPGGWLPALVLAVIAASGEGLPRGAWRELGSPALVVFGGITAWLTGDGSRGAMHATLGTLIAALVLIPARPAALRLLAPLCALELVVAGLPGTEAAQPWVAVVVLVPLSLLALTVDAWLGARLGARITPSPRLAGLRWAILPALAAAVVGIATFSPAQRIADAVRLPGNGTGTGPGLNPKPDAPRPKGSPGNGNDIGIHPGDQPPKDPTPAARLFLPADPGEVIYLRLAACSLLQRDPGTDRWRWLPAPGELELDPEPRPATTAIAQLVRMPGWGDTVLAPDDGGWVGLDGLFADGDANRWRIGLGEAIRSYPVALSGPPRHEPPADLTAVAAACRQVPPGMQDWPWERIERPEWRELPPEVAATRIGETLRDRCSYDLDVPKPEEGVDPLRTFLFSDVDRQRRGICEHFAGAAALLLRRAGHPARCVAGFASGQWDGSGIVFRRLHAHAWVEILSDDGRWLRADPTPPVAHAMADEAGRDANIPPPELNKAVPLLPPGATDWSRLLPWIVAACVAAVIAIVVRLRRQRSAGGRARDRQAVHRRRGEELVRLAQGLGLRVLPSDTASMICARITARTGFDLSRQLIAYENARFGEGPEPGPWPEIVARNPSEQAPSAT